MFISIMGVFISFLSIFLVLFPIGECSTTCLRDQKRSQPSSANSIISQALHKVLSTPNDGPCAGIFPTLPNGSVGNTIHRSNGSLILVVNRDNAGVHVGATECVNAFTSIIHNCIDKGGYWGGNATLGGITYAIYNEAFPAAWSPEPALDSHPSHSPSVSKAALPSHDPAVQGLLDALAALTESMTKTVLPPEPFAKISNGPLKIWPNAGVDPGFHHTISPVESVHISRGPQSSSLNPSSPKVTTTNAPRLPNKAGAIQTKTLHDVTGKPNSYSQTKTTDKNGHPTVLPVWFGPLGVAIVLTPLNPGPGLIPPPPGFVPLEIGPDGRASRQVSRVEPQTPISVATSSPTSRPSLVSSSSVSATSSPAASAISESWLILPKNGKALANNVLTSELERVFGRNLHTAQNPITGVVFWRAPLTLAQRNHYITNIVVSSLAFH